MARKTRFNMPGVPQHVIQRGNDRQACFRAPGDYRRYLDYLHEATQRFECRIHTYVLMTNHVHLLLTPLKEHAIAHTMQHTGQRFARYINRQYQRTGTLWEGRYKAGLVDSDNYLLTCMRYIELNPVRAGMVDQAGDYIWSSYGANALGYTDRLVEPHELYAGLGGSVPERCLAYRALFTGLIDKKTLDEIRATLNRELVLGSDRFKAQIEATTQRQTDPKRRGRPRRRNNVGVY